MSKDTYPLGMFSRKMETIVFRFFFKYFSQREQFCKLRISFGYSPVLAGVYSESRDAYRSAAH